MASTLDSVPANGPFDPYTQNIIITMPDGKTQFAANINTIFALQNIATQQVAIFGVQIGVSVVLMVILALMTQAEKRRSLVFILNLTALLFIFIRGVIQCVQVSGPLYNYYNWAANYYEHTDLALNESVALEVCTFIIVLAIELSLMLQVRIVCCTLSAFWRRALDYVSALIVAAALITRFIALVFNVVWNILAPSTTTDAQRGMVTTMSNVSTGMLMGTIFVFSLAFVAKLFYAIRQRRKMGMKGFGAVQIIFIMGCQTLIIPAIFGTVSYYALPGSQFYSLVPVVVATFLPLSSIWASTATKGNANIAAPNQWHNRRLPSTFRGNRTPAYSSEKGLIHTTVNTECTLVDDRSNSLSGSSPRKPGHTDSRDRDSIDLEMQKMGHIRVDRGYSVRSD